MEFVTTQTGDAQFPSELPNVPAALEFSFVKLQCDPMRAHVSFVSQ